MRYLPLTEEDRRDMLARIGAADIEALYRDVPAAARLKRPLDLPPHAGEMAVEREIGALAAKNRAAGEGPFFLGAGAYRHHVPAAVDHLIQRSEFLTSYTPYQPEIAQGTLQYLFEFQSQVALITGMEVANASLYDGATSCAEAVLMALRVTRRKRAILSGGLHPHYRETVATALAFMAEEALALPPDAEGVEDLLSRIDADTACVVVQNPTLFGHIADLSELAAACHARGALLIVAVSEVVSLGALVPPGAMGADIVVAEGQSIGLPLTFGGPYLGLFATKEKYLRQMPGRLAGETLDEEGRRGFVLTLSAREQHIRREKATSNICTNSGLCALAFCIHLTLLGEAGFTHLARLNHRLAARAAKRLGALRGVRLVNESFFNEFTLALPVPAAPLVERLAQNGVLAGVPLARLYPERPELANLLLVAVTETSTDQDLEALANALAEEI